MEMGQEKVGVVGMGKKMTMGGDGQEVDRNKVGIGKEKMGIDKDGGNGQGVVGVVEIGKRVVEVGMSRNGQGEDRDRKEKMRMVKEQTGVVGEAVSGTHKASSTALERPWLSPPCPCSHAGCFPPPLLVFACPHPLSLTLVSGLLTPVLCPPPLSPVPA